MPYKETEREIARTQGTYDFYIEIDCDCEELLDAIGLDYKESETDDTQNEVCISLTKDEYIEAITDSMWASHDLNEQSISAALLNHELGEYTTKVTIYTPSGDKITFE
jgi:hypothetical protein